MKLIYISEGNLPSKAANSIQVAKMAQAFAEKMADFELVTLGDLWSLLRGNEFDFRQWYGLHHEFKIARLPLLLKTEYPFPRYYREQRFPRWAALYARLRSPDLVYTRSGKTAEIALRLGLAVLWEWHAPPRHGLFQRQAFTNGRFLGVVTISEQLAQEYIKYGLTPGKVLVAHDGVDLERFSDNPSKHAARRKLSLPIDMKIAIYVGHLYENRGIEDIFATARQMSDVLFVLVGGWDADVQRRRQEVKQQRLTNVRVIGFLPNAQVPLYLAAADILLMPYSQRVRSVHWMSPMKMFEYMAARRPILATDLPAIRQVLQDHYNAILVAPDDSGALSNGLKTLLQNQLLMERLASQAYQDVQYYVWERRAERILGFVEDRLQDTKGRSLKLSNSLMRWGKRRMKQAAFKAKTRIHRVGSRAKGRLVEKLRS
jgi:glycosyltransferase involved in cell wall biosynthesis